MSLNLALVRHRRSGLLPSRGAACMSHRSGNHQSDNLRASRFWTTSVVIVQQTQFSKAEEPDAAFAPKFDGAGLLTAVAVDAASHAVLMVAFMDAEALAATRETGFAHFHSRSRGRLWKKGETSGHVLAVRRVLVDCDQDALVIECDPAGPACHTGEPTCFYRQLDGDVLRPVKT